MPRPYRLGRAINLPQDAFIQAGWGKRVLARVAPERRLQSGGSGEKPLAIRAGGNVTGTKGVLIGLAEHRPPGPDQTA
ncbi:MAG TPA: hypothetical protein VFB27_03045 [Opitutaceae bacterium]|nr:hypothetical protein [Opitutaceae bacterium]